MTKQVISKVHFSILFSALSIIVLTISSSSHAQDSFRYLNNDSLNAVDRYAAGRGFKSVGKTSLWPKPGLTSLRCGTGDNNSEHRKGGDQRDRYGAGKKLKTKTRYLRDAAEEAIDAGFNYALVRPLKTYIKSDSRVVVRGGFGPAYKDMQHSNDYTMVRQPCLAVDDLAAARILFNSNDSTLLADDESLVDLRQLLAMTGGKTRRSKRPYLSEQNFQNPGDRERIIRQLPVISRALSCSASLTPTSVENLRTSLTAQNRSKEKSCLDGLRTEAAASGWSGLTSESNPDRGYSLGTGSGIAPVKVISGERPANPDVWGEGWIDMSGRFPNLNGVALVRMSGNIPYILVASSSLSDAEMMDYSVYISSIKLMDRKLPGIQLRPHSNEVKKRFQRRLEIAQESGGGIKGLSETVPKDAQDGLDKGYTRAHEMYDIVSLLVAHRGQSCTIKDAVACADKIQAYNTIGPRLDDKQYSKISQPFGYKPFSR